MAVTRKPSKYTLSPEERQQRLQEAQDKLEEGVAALQDSEEYKRYLGVMGSFHRYSWGNTMLIHRQCPEATHVASYGAWKKMGRQVRKGATSIRIYAPLKWQRDATDEEKRKLFGTTDIEAKVGGLKGFTLVPVFDIASTDGDPLPEHPAKNLAATPDAEGLPDVLIGAAEHLGFRVRFADMPADTGGSFGLDRTGNSKGIITLATGRTNIETVKTVIHEIKHALIDADALRRGIGDSYILAGLEVVAESVAYVTSSALGLDTGDYSFGYVATWGGRPEIVKHVADQVQKISHSILDAIDHIAGAVATEEAA